MTPKINSTIFQPILILLFSLLASSCGDEQKTAAPPAVSTAPDTFTFFDVGKNTTLSKSLRKDLNKILGDDAIEYRNVIGLEINKKGFLKDYFPDLDKLNHDLNFPPGERVEHQTVKLMYRYPQEKNRLFDYVEFIFSEFTQSPLLIRVHFRRDESHILEALEKKYGPPETIHWNEEGAKSLYWENNRDILLLSYIPDQFGNPTHQIVIFFTEELERLVRAELEEKERQVRSSSGKTPF